MYTSRSIKSLARKIPLDDLARIFDRILKPRKVADFKICQEFFYCSDIQGKRGIRIMLYDFRYRLRENEVLHHELPAKFPKLLMDEIKSRLKYNSINVSTEWNWDYDNDEKK